MKTMTVRLPQPLAAEIEAESRRRSVSKSDVVRDRLEGFRAKEANPLAGIADLIGSIEEGLPADLSARKKHYLRVLKYGRDRNR